MKWYKIFDTVAAAKAQIPLNRAITVFLRQANVKICLAHTPQGIFAVDDACTHQGYSLAKGVCNYLNEIVCPWHSYRFSLCNGTETTGYGCPDLRTYPVEIDEQGVWIGVPAQTC